MSTPSTKTPTDKELLSPVKNWMRVRLGYSMDIVLSTNDATKLLSIFEKAEQYKWDSEHPSIEPMKSNTIELEVMSVEDYKRFKMNHLLGINKEH